MQQNILKAYNVYLAEDNIITQVYTCLTNSQLIEKVLEKEIICMEVEIDPKAINLQDINFEENFSVSIKDTCEQLEVLICPLHEERPANTVCLQCSERICYRCQQICHKDHPVKLVKDLRSSVQAVHDFEAKNSIKQEHKQYLKNKDQNSSLKRLKTCFKHKNTEAERSNSKVKGTLILSNQRLVFIVEEDEGTKLQELVKLNEERNKPSLDNLDKDKQTSEPSQNGSPQRNRSRLDSCQSNLSSSTKASSCSSVKKFFPMSWNKVT